MMINNKAESRWVIGLHSLAQRKYLAWKEWAAQHEHCGASQIIATDVFRCDAQSPKRLRRAPLPQPRPAPWIHRTTVAETAAAHPQAVPERLRSEVSSSRA